MTRPGRFIVLIAVTITLSACQNQRVPVALETALEAGPRPAVIDEPVIPETPAPESDPATADLTFETPADSPPLQEPRAAPDLWARIRQGFRLDHHTDRRRVQREIEWYQRHPDYIDRVVKRATPYLFYISGELEKHGLPLEFALLPVVESAYDPFAYSHGRASGLWQFIPSTARLYGLKIDWWYDGRRDIVDSTGAAIRYLEELHRIMDQDWLLALAAYNSGQGNLGIAIRRNRAAGKPTDFFSLKVLRETHSYVPRLLAISEIVANPAAYGIELPGVPNTARWAMVDIGSQLDLNKASELAGISPEQLYGLNPGYNQWSTHPEGPHRLLLPLDSVDRFRENLRNLPAEQRLAWKRHRIREGENLGIIASRYGTTVEAIRTANHLRGTLIRTGRYLTIPVASGETSYTQTAGARLRNRQDRLRQKLGEPHQYRVRSGDSFWKISRQYGVNMRDLARWNGMGTTDTLRPGTELLVFTSSVSEGPGKRPNVIRKVNYRVRRGESLSLIADKFNLPLNEITRWNSGLDTRKPIHPGDRITLYVDVTSTE